MIRTIVRRVLIGWMILVCWPLIVFLEWMLDSKHPSANLFAKYIWYGSKGIENDD